jgi:CBS domain-containing protein
MCGSARQTCARDIMTPDPAVCPADATVDQVAKLMVHHQCRAIIVIDLAERPHGIVTDHDIIRRVVAEGRNPLAYPVEACLSRPVVTVPVGASLDAVIATLQTHHISWVVVVDGEGRCVGLISEEDVAVTARA